MDPFLVLTGRVQVQQSTNDERVIIEESSNRLGTGGIAELNEFRPKLTQKKENKKKIGLSLLRDGALLAVAAAVAAAQEASTLPVVEMLAHKLGCFGGPLDVRVSAENLAGSGQGRDHQTCDRVFIFIFSRKKE